MEDLEARALTSTPEHCKPTIAICRWHFGESQKRNTQELIDHLNSIDDTGNIKFTHEEESNKSIASPDMKIQHNDAGDIKIKTYPQYLLWTSEHPIAHKLSVVRTLYDRTTSITDEEDREEEEKHTKSTNKLPVSTVGKTKPTKNKPGKTQQTPSRYRTTEVSQNASNAQWKNTASTHR